MKVDQVSGDWTITDGKTKFAIREGNKELSVYRAVGTIYSPSCWEEHAEQNGDIEIPVDWPHTLRAIYTVRCNLFHGDKSRTSENDRNLVYKAFRVLATFLREGNYLTGNRSYERHRAPASGARREVTVRVSLNCQPAQRSLPYME